MALTVDRPSGTTVELTIDNASTSTWCSTTSCGCGRHGAALDVVGRRRRADEVRLLVSWRRFIRHIDRQQGLHRRDCSTTSTLVCTPLIRPGPTSSMSSSTWEPVWTETSRGGRWLVIPPWVSLVKKSDLRNASVSGDGVSLARSSAEHDRRVDNLLPKTTDTTQVTYIIGGHSVGRTFASQLSNVETMRSEITFGTICAGCGLQLQGARRMRWSAYAELSCLLRK
jgi:hypothetical protein